MKLPRTSCIRAPEKWRGADVSNLLVLLEDLLSAKFVYSDEVMCETAGEVLVDAGYGFGTRGNPARSSISLPDADGASLGTPRALAIQFSAHPSVPFPFRGKSIRTFVTKTPVPLELRSGEVVLATVDDGPVWAVSGDRPRRYRSAFAVPELSEGEGLYNVFNGSRFMEMLPLIHWLEELRGEMPFNRPPLRACFMFDDPNLHWPTYGYVRFHEIAAHAERENYHVSFATVPLDTWFTHDSTAAVFRNNPKRVSLLFHGNNHSKYELGRHYTPSGRTSLLSQAVCRMEQFESKSGVRVDRIMVPPHGACTEEMLRELPKCGFEGACISHGSLRKINSDKEWARRIGYRPAEWVERCAILPRWSITGEQTNTILLAAYLGQPIVLRGHHADLRDGIDLLDCYAAMINGLGDVLWGGMAQLSRKSYEVAQFGNEMIIRMYSRAIVLRPSDNTQQLVVEHPFDGARLFARQAGKALPTTEAGSHRTIILVDNTKDEVAITLEIFSPRPLEKKQLLTSSWPILRRLLTEGRDRLMAVARV